MPTQRIYTDLDFNLEKSPVTDDVLRVYDLNSVKTSIKNLVRTEFYGRPFHPEIGSAVAGLLFENWSPLVNRAVEETIRELIANHEPRAEVTGVLAEFDDGSNTFRVSVNLYLYALMQEATVDIILDRAR